MICVGSRGDLHPFIALGMKLKERGDDIDIRIATHQNHQSAVENAGFEYRKIPWHSDSLMAMVGSFVS